MVLRHDEKPGNCEGGSVGCVDDRIDDVEPGKGEAVKERLLANVRGQEGGDSECEEGVDIHGKLERREMQAG